MDFLPHPYGLTHETKLERRGEPVDIRVIISLMLHAVEDEAGQLKPADTAHIDGLLQHGIEIFQFFPTSNHTYKI